MNENKSYSIVMAKCDFCGMEVLFPFICEHCGGRFCTYHKLPENHHCPILPKNTLPTDARITQRNPRIRKTTVVPTLGETRVEPVPENATKNPEPPHRKESIGSAKGKEPRARKRSTLIITALCVMLVVIPVVAAFGSYTFGFSNGSDSGYNQGHEVGYQSGNSSGYQLGYGGGYSQGNATGYGNGYMIGYENGNLSGYQQGQDFGWVQGNSSGFSEGYSNGNVSGYSSGYQNGYSNGNSSGYESGYQIGYASGNSSGYTSGFNLGFSEGNSTGYGNGYQNGQLSGSQSGYSQGFANGNTLGYQTGYSQGFSNGNTSGYQTGYLQGVKDGAGRGYNARDPTNQEMLNFITADQTDKNPYVVGSYVCWNFAADVTNNAFKAGYRCGWVYIEYVDAAHAIVCFNTTDHGLIFIEPQDDMMINLVVGQPYLGETVLRYVIIW